MEQFLFDAPHQAKSQPPRQGTRPAAFPSQPQMPHAGMSLARCFVILLPWVSAVWGSDSNKEGMGSLRRSTMTHSEQEETVTMTAGGDMTARNSQGVVWKNWEDTVECSPGTLATPTSIEEVASLVKSHKRVRAVGLGHSYNDFACSNDLMLNMTALNQIVYIDEEHQTVTVQAGMKTRELIKHLAAAKFTLATFPFFIDQTIGGAIVNGAHGSSTRIGSLSTLLRAVKIVTANGDVRIIKEGDGDLMEAARVSVGLLGVIVELTLAIVPDEVIYRDLDIVRQESVVWDLKHALLNPLSVDELQWWYFPKIGMLVRSSIERFDDLIHHKDEETDLNIGKLIVQFYQNRMRNRPSGKNAIKRATPIMRHKDKRIASTFMLFSMAVQSLLPGKFRFSEGLPRQEVLTTDSLKEVYGTYDQYEFAIPFDHMIPCWEAFIALFKQNPQVADDLLVAMCVRFLREESAFLSMSYGGPHLYINFDNYDAYNRTEGWSRSFQAVKDLMHSDTCQARAHHFGKSAWSTSKGGAWSVSDVEDVKQRLGSAWERFMAVVKTWDPEGKFADIRHVLRP